MCGIAGIVWRKPAPDLQGVSLVSKMLRAQAHRGPDDRGVTRLPGAAGEELGALGNVRLAILDRTAAGRQPMSTAAYTLVVNGELYNHRDVRRELGQGVAWSSGTDTETLLRAILEWGPGCLARFRGMFAFAVWDQSRRELWCVRDRLGIKPLYYAWTPRAFVFASEVRAILASGLLRPPRLDGEALASYVRFGAVSEPGTLVRGVRSLRAGHSLRVQAARATAEERWWSPLESRAPGRLAIPELLARAAGEHLLADVPVASLLSSGLDSGVVTALAARQAPGRLRTFTLACGDHGCDESGPAEEVARACGTEHTTVRLSEAELAGSIQAAVRAMDLPSTDGLNTYLVSQVVAAAGIKVVLSGLGGDELFGGYPSFRWVPLASRLAPLLGRVPALVRAAAGGGGRGERAQELLARCRTLTQRYEAVRALWSEGELKRLGVDWLAPLAAWPVDGVGGRTAVSLLELSGYMRSTLLRDSDAMSMAHSLELRVPLLDHELVEACLASGAAEGAPKALLRSVAMELLPSRTLALPKRGFALPMNRWMRGVLAGFVRDGLEALRAAGTPLRLEGLEARFARGELPWARLWQFVVLGHWFARHEELVA